MTVAVAVAPAKLSTGNQDITAAALGGATPKAVLFLYSRAPANGVVTNGGGDSYGFADAANQVSVATYIKHGGYPATGPFVSRVAKSDKCIAQLVASGSTIIVHSEATFVAFIAGGVRINWTTATTDAWLVTAIFFSGSDWTVSVGNTAGGTVVTGFEPHCVLLISALEAMDSVISTNRAKSTFGWAVWRAGVRTPREAAHWAWTLTRQLRATNNFVNASAYNFDPFTQYAILLDQNPDGFDIAAGTEKFGYLALRYTGTGRLATGSIAITEASGDQVKTGFGGQPGGFLFLLLAQDVGVNSDWRFGYSCHTAAKSGGYSVGGYADGSGVNAAHAEFVFATACEDEIVMLNNDGTPTVNVRATLSSFDADGVTFNFTDPPTFDASHTAVQWEYLTILDAGSEVPTATERLFATIVD